MGSPSVIALFGPTGVGKTELALELADRLFARGEVPVAVSADSMQVYRELPILTGAPTAAEQERLEHRLVGHVSVSENYDVATHATLAHAEIDELRADGRRPMVVGGTGLYLRATLAELDLRPKPAAGVRERLTAELEQDGVESLYERLMREAPDLAAEIDRRNARRVLRALETVEQGASRMSRGENRLWSDEMRVPTDLFALVMERDALYRRIDDRVDEMIALGAAEEVRAAQVAANRTARQALGFSELLADDPERMKTNTRRYAKRQLTWLAKLGGAVRVDVTGRSSGDVADEILSRLTG